MPAEQRGTAYKTKTQGWGIQWRETGGRYRRCGFPTKTAALAHYRDEIRPRIARQLEPALNPDVLTFDALCDLYLAAHAPGRAATTIRTLTDRLKRPRDVFGKLPLADLEHTAPRIAAWRGTLPSGSAAAIVGAFRQVLDAAIAWGVITKNPVKLAGRAPAPKRGEVTPFTRVEVDALAVELGETWGPLVIFAAETGLRPGEWAALEWRDVDRASRGVNVQRTYTFPRTGVAGEVKPYTKTTRRQVPLSGRALAALELVVRRIDTPLVFAAARGEPVNLHNWRAREWVPAIDAAGIPRRRIYDLRHTFATLALAAGIQPFELSRYMGTSVRMIDATYGHLAPNAAAAAADRLDRHIAAGG